MKTQVEVEIPVQVDILVTVRDEAVVRVPMTIPEAEALIHALQAAVTLQGRGKSR
jgi:hypothetical protein